MNNNSQLERVLEPYKRDCRYLRMASIDNKDNKAKISAIGEFSIMQSCYVNDTGHFNAVEFNICFNQLAYYLVAECIQNKLLNNFNNWDADKYFRHQLSDCLILRFFSSFRKPMQVDKFFGRMNINKISEKNKRIFIDTTCNFYDENGGASEGGALLLMKDTSQNFSSAGN